MRRKPYTAIGIKRLQCARVGCNNRAHAQWNICADDNQPRAICRHCDIKLNQLAMRFMFGRSREADIKAYRDKLLKGPSNA